MPGPPDARGRGHVRRAGRARLSLDREALARALLRPEAARAIPVHGRTEAAVLVPLYADAAGELHAVFTRRRADLRRHAGEISFPGGRRDPGESLERTALREAHEEVGLPPEAVDVVGALEPTPTVVTSYAVYPFVGLISPGFAWAVEHAEVDEVLELRVADLRAGATGRAFEAGGHVVWGATARIVRHLLARLAAAGL